ncbi:S8 family serine peptidase [Jidongwangia harbinensis]|uniref:S8 family serine peptidase n=1 Tax=Jidongwangia harbinensis TaxID=2878561 RepID=UPI001CD9B343|nr:S8 family serine peptidase [Jidongwangia harbinensis]MCA2216728.1 S8 family serine peptidase [Jidongwangia harbinensis]
MNPLNSARHPRRARARLAGTVAAALAAALLLAPAAPATAADTGQRRPYLVQLAENPVASYTGGVAGIAATRPKAGTRLARTAAGVQPYRRHLSERRTDVLAAAGIPRKRATVTFDTVFNGFAATLTPAEVRRLKGTPGVARVHENATVQARTNHSPRMLGLAGPDGVWQQRFGGARDAGAGTVIGVIDTGFWPESASFGAMPEPRPDQAAVDAKWKGTCDTGTTGPVTCNNKVIGARWYDTGRRSAVAGEYASPRDAGGHGTHTASTAAGLPGVPVTVDGQNFGTVPGIAPGARLAIYKSLWRTAGGGSTGDTIDTVHAIEDAVRDGVDVISMSIGFGYAGLGATDTALYHASTAGVFVAAAAGNDGPLENTVENAWPWMTTVAASSLDTEAARVVRLGNGVQVSGGGTGTAAVAGTRLVTGEAAGLPDTDATACAPGTLDRERVSGAVLACRFDDKRTAVLAGRAVQEAGGAGILLYNIPQVALTDAVRTPIPSVHLDRASWNKVNEYLTATPDATATIAAGAERSQRAPEVSWFSGAGPWNRGGGGLLKPDITAPGQNILAAVSPVAQPHGNVDYAHLSGTSMATPHIAGLAALVRAQHPGWSPSAVKSALMTTAGGTDNEGKPMQATVRGEPVPGGFYSMVKGPATPFHLGAGEVQPRRTFDPGLVYETEPADWVKFTCGLGFTLQADREACGRTGSIEAAQLNYPSISLGDVYGTRTVTRTVTNVAATTSTYTAKVNPPAGWRGTVQPATLTLAPGERASFTVELARTDGPFGAYSFGDLTWSDNAGHTVRSPIVLRGQNLKGPANVHSTAATGTQALPVTSGFAGTLTAKLVGFSGGTDRAFTVEGVNPDFDPDAAGTPGVPDVPASARTTVTVPEGNRDAEVRVDYAGLPAGEQIDLIGYDAEGRVHARTWGRNGMSLSEPGEYTVLAVRSAAAPGRENARVDGTLRFRTMGPNTPNDERAELSPASFEVRNGQTVEPVLRWTGLTPGRTYTGYVQFSDGTRVLHETEVLIEP